MLDVTLEHFKRAAADIGANGDNDTLPFDIDTRFVKDKQDELAELAYAYSQDLASLNKNNVRNSINALDIFSERLLVPTGAAGFRVTTKIHPFWNIYLNGLAIAIAEANEPQRSDRVHSYRYTADGNTLFNRLSAWRSFREAAIEDCNEMGESAVIVQTDISSFYEHIYHHRLETFAQDLFPGGSELPTQIDRFLSKLAAGRSFGLPVGGQCSRILAELLLTAVDRALSDARIVWRRYVDDFVLITPTQADAYRALAVLSHSLADYGLTLNRTKTTFLTAKHFCDYVHTQLDGGGDEAKALREIDMRFDPYSDRAEEDYEDLKETVQSLEIRTLLDLELNKGQPDSFLVAQIGRTLKLQSPVVALQLCETLLAPQNLHAFRASWSTIMRGIYAIQADNDFEEIHNGIDQLLDAIPTHSPHLLITEASCLFYLRTIRLRRTQARAEYVLSTYNSTESQAVKRACIDCWHQWRDRGHFIRLRNTWNAISPEQQRMLWLAAPVFGDDGNSFRAQVKRSTERSWSLGIERGNRPTFASIYQDWCDL